MSRCQQLPVLENFKFSLDIVGKGVFQVEEHGQKLEIRSWY